MNTRAKSTQSIVYTGMFAAILAVLSQIQIPMPSGVPVTLQTFAIAMIGFLLGWKQGVKTILVYILLGAVGLPVFTGFAGGFAKITGPTGGFILGFPILVVACGVVSAAKYFWQRMFVSTIGLFVFHFFGIIQFTFLSELSFWKAALLVSVPYLLKDFISLWLAHFAAQSIRKRLI